MTLLKESARANSVPAAAVRQDVQMLFIIIGCKGYVGGSGWIPTTEILEIIL